MVGRPGKEATTHQPHFPEQSPPPNDKMSVEGMADVVVLQIKTDKKQLTLSEMRDMNEFICHKYDLAKESLLFKGTFVGSIKLQFWLSSRILPFVLSQSLSWSIGDIRSLLNHDIRQISIEDAYCLIMPTAQVCEIRSASDKPNYCFLVLPMLIIIYNN